MLTRGRGLVAASLLAGVVFVVSQTSAGAGGRWRPQATPAVSSPLPSTTSTNVAPPTTPTTPPTPDALLDAAMQRLPPGVWDFLSAHGWTIAVGGARPGLVGATYRWEKRSSIFIRPNESFDTVLGAVAHEVGHMVDFECFSDAERADILAARGRPSAAWFPTATGDDRKWGLGDWAETFASTVTGRWDGLWPNPGAAEATALVAEHRCA